MIRGIETFDREVRDFSEPLSEIAKDFQEITKRNFQKGGYPVKFAPLTNDRYKKWKAKHYPGQPVMRLKDNLYNALTGGTSSDISAARSIKKITKDTLLIGADSPYLQAQYNRGRRAIQITQKDQNRWTGIIMKWLRDKWKKKVEE